jgi:hypothetical protein
MKFDCQDCIGESGSAVVAGLDVGLLVSRVTILELFCLI